jgi:dephospho-CoA kinase
MRIIGLTGGIGMGKSTAAAAFRRARIPVFDADLAVHRMQAKGGRAVKAIEAAFPGTTRNGAVDRAALRQAVLGNREALSRLEHLLHPMVEAEERAFVGRARRAGRRAVVLDIPLLFEVKGDQRVDTVVVVSAPRAIQIHRVGLRRRMSKADVEAVIARQMPDAEKRRRADLVVRTGLSRNHTLRILNRFIRTLRG